MAAPMELTLESVRLFMIEKGGRISSQEIAMHYKKVLNDPEQKDAKSAFKDIVNTIATVKKVNNEKYLVLKKKYRDGLPNRKIVDTPPTTPKLPTSPRTVYASYDALDSLPSRDSPQSPPTSPRQPSSLPHSLSSPDLKSTSGSSNIDEWEQAGAASIPLDMPKPSEVVGDQAPVPVAPLRKKKSMKENRKPRAPVPPKQGGESSPGSQPEASDEADDSQRMNVKEQAKKLNKMVSESQLTKPLTPNSAPGAPYKKREREKTVDEDDSAVNPHVRREWELKSAAAEYHDLVKILKDTPSMAKHKGYTALHWAAKHGNQDIVKLIAGTHDVSVNIRSHGGYTPLHIAASQNNKAVYDLLVQTYGADSNLRDYSGKKAEQLFKDYQSKKIVAGSSKAGSHRHSGHRRGSDRELGFLRIGSLNVKVRKTAEAFTSRSEVYLRKGWGSADSIPEVSDEQLMPPPKHAPVGRRQKPKQRPATICSGSMDSLQTDSESDSASGAKP